MPEWGNMIDPDHLVKEMLALKSSLEDFSKRMEKVEDVLFANQGASCYYCADPDCTGHTLCV